MRSEDVWSNKCPLLAVDRLRLNISKTPSKWNLWDNNNFTFYCLIKTPSLITPPFLRENFQILKTCLIKPPPFVPKNIVLITTFFHVFLVDGSLWNVLLPMHWSHWFESHGVNTMNSSEKKEVKRLLICPSLQRKSEGRRKLTSLPWSESIATWATLISGKCARQVRSRKHL